LTAVKSTRSTQLKSNEILYYNATFSLARYTGHSYLVALLLSLHSRASTNPSALKS